MRKGIESKKKRKAVHASAEKRSKRAKKVAAEKHIRRKKFEAELLLMKHKEEMIYQEYLERIGIK